MVKPCYIVVGFFVQIVHFLLIKDLEYKRFREILHKIQIKNMLICHSWYLLHGDVGGGDLATVLVVDLCVKVDVLTRHKACPLQPQDAGDQTITATTTVGGSLLPLLYT